MLENVKYNYLVRSYKNRIYSYAFYMMRNRMDADDITQEVFIRIWKNMGLFRMSSAKSWIMKTTHNLCLDFLRSRQAAVSRHEFIDNEAEDTLVEEYIPGPDTSADSNLAGEAIENALGKLSENLRSIFIMYEIQGFRYEEISKSLEIPLNSVKVYLMRARRKLQKELESYKPVEVK